MERKRPMVVAAAAAAVLAGGVTGAALLAGTPVRAATAAATSHHAQGPPVRLTSCGSGPRLTATGNGTAQGPPDTLNVQLGVQTTAATAAAALAQNSSEAQSLIAKLEADGVSQPEIQTSGLYIQPNYGPGPNPRITGYQVGNTVAMELQGSNLSRAGQLVDDAAATVGSDIRVDGVSFSLQNDTSLEAQAKAQAVAGARQQAEAMAAADGLVLGSLCSISDDASAPTPEPEYANGGVGFAAGLSSGAGTTSEPIESGSQQVSAQATAVYALDRR